MSQSSISRNWNVTENYWLLNAGMLSIKLFRNLHAADKSKGKSRSSKLMWAIALYCDPHEDNPWKNTSRIDKEELIRVEYLENPDFDWAEESTILLVEEYDKRCLSIGERELVELENKVTDRARFIKGTKYSLDFFDEETGRAKKGTADQLDKMLLNTSKIYDQFEVIRSKISKETSKGHLRGGATESASETGEI